MFRWVSIKQNGATVRFDLRKWWISVLGKRNFHSTLPTPLSNLSLILHCQTRLLFIHVKQGPRKPRSIRPHWSKQSLKQKTYFSLKVNPPFFSSSSGISLKSPNSTQGTFTKGAKIFKYCQSGFLLLKLGEAWIVVSIKVWEGVNTFTSACILNSLYPNKLPAN